MKLPCCASQIIVSILLIAVSLKAAEGRQLQGTKGCHLACEVFQKDVSGTSSALYNEQFTGFNSLLLNVMNWGGIYLQTSWCGSGGFNATILAPSNKALLAGFEELHRRFNINPNPLQYKNPFSYQSGNSVPLSLAIDAIIEAGMLPQSINLYTDKRVPSVSVRPGKHHKYFQVQSSISNINPGQVLRFWRNIADGRVYVYLPGGILPGPYRVNTKTKRHVKNWKTCSDPVNDVYVYEVEGLLVPGTVALGLLSAPAPHKVKNLAPILRSIGPKGFTLLVPPKTP